MKYRYYLIIMLFILRAPVVAGAEQYLCVEDYATGFSYNELTKSWGPTNFRTEAKFIISNIKKEDLDLYLPEDSKFKITEVGKSYPICTCKEGSFKDSGYFLCDCIVGEFKFNKDNGRFLKSYLVGYLDMQKGKEENNDNTPYISIGKCSPF